MTKAQLVKAALKARQRDNRTGGGNAGKSDADLETPAEDKNETAAQETAEDKGKSLPQAGQNSAQGLPNPKKPSAASPDAGKGRGAFFPDLVKHPKGKGGKAVLPPKKPAGAIYFPKAKTR